MRPRTKTLLRRSIKRILLYLTLPILFFSTIRLLWGFQAARQLAAYKDHLRAVHIPIEPEAAPAPGKNPADLLLHASNSFPITIADETLIDGDESFQPNLGWTDAQKPLVRTLLTKWTPALDEIDAAAQMTQVPIFDITTQFGPIRRLAKLMRTDAIFLHEARDDATALHRLDQILTVARITEGHNTIIGHLVATAIRALATNTLERILPTLQFDQPGLTLQQARILLEHLQEPDAHDAIARSIEGEMFYIRKMYDGLPHINEWWIHPLHDSALRLDLQRIEGFLPVVQADTWPLAHSRFLSTHHADSTHNVDIIIDLEAFSPPERFALFNFRGVCDSGATTLLLAAQIETHFHGQYPSSASQLVPSLLASLPLDPFTADHEPLHYRLDPDGPTIWSVGENGTNENAVVHFSTRGEKLQRYGNTPYDQTDIIYGAAWLNSNTPAPASVPASVPAATR